MYSGYQNQYRHKNYNYSYRNRRRRNRRFSAFWIVLAIVFVVAILGFGIYILISNSFFGIGSSQASANVDEGDKRLVHTAVNGEKYESKTIKESNYIIHYPVTDIKEIDKSINEQVKFIEKCSEASGAYFTAVDYTVETADSNYLSIVFKSSFYNEEDKMYDADVFTSNYDIKSKCELKSGDIFKPNFYSFISDYVREYFKSNKNTAELAKCEEFEAATSANKLHFEQFSVNDKNCIFYFTNKTLFAKEGNVQSVAVPITKAAAYLNIKIKSAQAGEKKPSVTPLGGDVDPNKPMIALTFDDGPSYENTEKILNVLTKNNARATFFVVGTNAEAYPDILKKEIEAGCQIGNHTAEHLNLSELSDKEVTNAVEKVNNIVKKATGVVPTAVRPPYGAYNKKVQKILNKYKFILWSVDTEDWKDLDAKKTSKKVLSEAYDGAIILMHDIHPSTAEAAETFVPKLIEQGYQLVTVDELLYYKGKDIQGGETYPW